MENNRLYVGFNSRVACLDRTSGETVWEWTARKGTGPAVLLLDGDRLFVSVHGYTYALDPRNGDELWFNPLPGMGLGVPTLTTATARSTNIAPHHSAQQSAAQAGQGHAAG